MARPDTGRDLLFGLLAFQNNFIDREALLGAFAAWVADKGRSIGDLLVERGALAAPVREALEVMVEAHVRGHGGDPEQSLAALSTAGSAREALESIADPDLQASLGHVPRTSQAFDADPYATRASAVGAPTS